MSCLFISNPQHVGLILSKDSNGKVLNTVLQSFQQPGMLH